MIRAIRAIFISLSLSCFGMCIAFALVGMQVESVDLQNYAAFCALSWLFPLFLTVPVALGASSQLEHDEVMAIRWENWGRK